MEHRASGTLGEMGHYTIGAKACGLTKNQPMPVEGNKPAELNKKLDIEGIRYCGVLLFSQLPSRPNL